MEIGVGLSISISNITLITLFFIFKCIHSLSLILKNYITRLGLDAKLLTDIINTSTGRCWTTEKYNPVPDILPNVPSSKGYEVKMPKQQIDSSFKTLFFQIKLFFF